MIDTNIIEKEYDIKDSQCNFRGQGVGGAARGGGGARAKGLIGQGGWVERGVVGGAYISRDN